MALDERRRRELEEASAFYRRTERLNAPRGPHEHEPAADHLAHELKAAAHEAWYVAQDAPGDRDVARAAAEIAAEGRPVTADQVLAHSRGEATRSHAAKGPADIGSMPPYGAAMLRRGGRE